MRFGLCFYFVGSRFGFMVAVWFRAGCFRAWAPSTLGPKP